MVWFILVVDSDSLRLHLEVGRSAFQKFADLIDLYPIEVYGQPSDEVLSLLEDKAAMLGDGSRASRCMSVRPASYGRRCTRPDEVATVDQPMSSG